MPEKNLGGRPSEYKLEYCDKAIELGEQGDGLEELAADIGVWRTTIYDWMEHHEEFADAITRMREKSEQWWRREGKKGIWGGKKFNDRAYNLQMMNRFNWNKKEETTVKGELADTLKTMYERLSATPKPPDANANK